MPTLAQKAVLLFGGQTYASKITNLFGSSIVSYLPLSEGAGSVAADIGGRGLNGAYTAVTLGQPGIGDGRTSASFDGTTSFVNWYSAGLAAAFNGDEGSFFAWLIVPSAATWANGNQTAIVNLLADGNNDITLAKTATGTLYFDRVAGATDKAAQSAVQSTTSPLLVGMTWSVSGDAQINYVNGVKIGSTLTGLAAFVGSVAATYAVVGAGNTTPNQVWPARLAHALLLNRAATAAEALAMAAV